MNIIQFKLFLISLIFLPNVHRSQQNGVVSNEKNIYEICATLRENIIILNHNKDDLAKLLSDEQPILDAIQRTLLHPDTVSSLLTDCLTVDNKLTQLHQAIQKKIDDNGQKHSQQLEEISGNLNCFDIKSQQLNDTTALYKQQINKLEILAERFEKLKQKVENYKPEPVTANEQLNKILMEIKGKLDAQEPKLRELESQIPLIEKASEYLELRKKKKLRKCKKCHQLYHENTLFSVEDE